jgi:putative ABC transport system ATP-binding protein
MSENEFQRHQEHEPAVALTDITSGVTLVVGQPQGASRPPVPVINVENIKKTYSLGETKVRALRGISLEIAGGEFVAIMGPSGYGKTTFMNLLGCLDRPTRGEYTLAGRLVSDLSADELAAVRNQLIGFVFQGFNLLARATALKNVMLPLVYAGYSRQERERLARRALKRVGLATRMHHRPHQLSGGQQQRVAIARALVNSPSLLLADEPTGNLDSCTSLEIMTVLQRLNQRGLTIVLVTHDADVAAYAGRQVVFRDGRVVRDERVDVPRSAQNEWVALTSGSPNVPDRSSIQIEEKHA